MYSKIQTLRHGLLGQRILERLRKIGLNINPYYLIREGAGPLENNWSCLDAEFTSQVFLQSDMSAMCACTAWNTPEVLQQRLDKGHLCIVLKQQQQIVGYTWVDFKEVNDSVCDIELQPGEVYLYDAFIAPEYRGRGLASYMRVECYQQVRRAGADIFYSISDYFNSPAIRFKQKLHAKFVRLYLDVKVGRFHVGHWVLKEYL